MIEYINVTQGSGLIFKGQGKATGKALKGGEVTTTRSTRCGARTRAEFKEKVDNENLAVGLGVVNCFNII